LPAAGKTTLARRLACHLGAAYLRIDTVEQGLRDLCACNVQGEGYRLSYRIAADNLAIGISVVADSCNPWELTRKEWRQVALAAGAAYIDVEVVCSDRVQHRQRLASRQSDIAGLVLPDWNDVQSRDYHGWTQPRLVVDTTSVSADEAFARLLAGIDESLPLDRGGPG